MQEIIKNSILVGLGIAAVGRKKFKKVYETLKDEGEKFRDEIPVIQKRWQRIEMISDRMEQIGQKVMQRLNIATQKELSELSKKIEKILKQKSVVE
ncbi:MAG: hypothetical protein ABIL69_00750 [candidate division WOR-3 bacterium]